MLLVYLVTRCCDRKPRPRRSITLLKCSLAILALLCSGAVAVGLYGNDDVHNGLVQLVAAAMNVDGILMGVRNQVGLLSQNMPIYSDLSNVLLFQLNTLQMAFIFTSFKLNWYDWLLVEYNNQYIEFLIGKIWNDCEKDIYDNCVHILILEY